MGAERNGIEDARLVRFEYEDGTPTYFATYTAFDGVEVAQQLLETTDFRSFTSAPVVGLPADKGLALFPRLVGGRFAALFAIGPRDERRRVLGRPAAVEGRRFPTRSPPGPGRCSSSATAALRSRPRPAGSRSPTASARCAPTGSEPCCSISRTRPGSSASSASLCSARPRRAGRLRAERRLLLRLPRTRRHPRASLRHRRLFHRCGHLVVARAARRPHIELEPQVRDLVRLQQSVA